MCEINVSSANDSCVMICFIFDFVFVTKIGNVDVLMTVFFPNNDIFLRDQSKVS